MYFWAGGAMKLEIVIREAEEGGFWAEVPSIPGCATQGDTFEELWSNLYQAVEGCLPVTSRTPLSDLLAHLQPLPEDFPDVDDALLQLDDVEV